MRGHVDYYVSVGLTGLESFSILSIALERFGVRVTISSDCAE